MLFLLSLMLVFRKASCLFSDAEEELEFMRDCGLDIAEVHILIQQGQFLEAADLHIRENRMLDAVEVLLKDKDSKEAVQRASQSLLDALWSVLGLRRWRRELKQGQGEAAANQ